MGLDLQAYDVALIPLITGLIQVAKLLGLPSKYSPLIGLVLGVLSGIFYVHPQDIAGGVLVGLMLGLGASGLYSGTKNTKEIVKGDK